MGDIASGDVIAYRNVVKAAEEIYALVGARTVANDITEGPDTVEAPTGAGVRHHRLERHDVAMNVREDGYAHDRSDGDTQG